MFSKFSNQNKIKFKENWGASLSRFSARLPFIVANVSGQGLNHRSRSATHVVSLVDLHERVIGPSQHGLGVFERLNLACTSVLTSCVILKKPIDPPAT